MKKDTRTLDKILWECFKLFLHKGYKEVTIPDIENAIGMTRGAVFYYVKDKNELFKAVIDRYVLEKQDVNNKIKHDKDSRLLQFIIDYVGSINRTRDSIQPSDTGDYLFSYLNLISTALTYYDGFREKAVYILEQDVLLWEKTIERAKVTKEIRDNVNTSIAAKKFQRLFYGQSFLNGIVADFNSSELLELYIDEYNLLKI